MSRHAVGPAARGSQKWLQVAVNRRPQVLEHALAEFVQVPIWWVSPVADDDYAEYRDGDAYGRIGLAPMSPPLDQFWPRGGPQWDGLGMASDGSELLVEAKAHVGELVSSPSSAGEASLATITRALQDTRRWMGAEGTGSWTGTYYQYANRLAHLYHLRQLNGLWAYLVFLYFCGDADMEGPASPDEWRPHISGAHDALGIAAHPDGVLEVFLDVTDLY